MKSRRLCSQEMITHTHTHTNRQTDGQKDRHNDRHITESALLLPAVRLIAITHKTVKLGDGCLARRLADVPDFDTALHTSFKSLIQQWHGSDMTD